MSFYPRMFLPLDHPKAQRLRNASEGDEPKGASLPHAAAPSSSRGRARFARMVEAATELFLRNGYGATSIEAILQVSGGSKATLYSYFTTKEDLFRAVIDEVLATGSQRRLDPNGDLRQTLTDFIADRVEWTLSPRHQALLRLVVAERDRFPDLSRAYYERGPMRTRRMLETYFEELPADKRITPTAARDAVATIFGAVANPWIIDSLLLGELDRPPSEEIRTRAARVVDCLFTTAHLE